MYTFEQMYFTQNCKKLAFHESWPAYKGGHRYTMDTSEKGPKKFERGSGVKSHFRTNFGISKMKWYKLSKQSM